MAYSLQAASFMGEQASSGAITDRLDTNSSLAVTAGASEQSRICRSESIHHRHSQVAYRRTRSQGLCSRY